MKRVLALLLCAVSFCTLFFGCKKVEQKDEANKEVEVKYAYDGVFSSETDEVKTAYLDVCNAIINRQEEVTISGDIINSVTNILFTSFPLVDLIESFDIKNDDTGVTFVYANNTEEHNKIVENFNANILAILKECKLNQVSDNQFLFNVYNYIALNAKRSENDKVKVKDTVIDNTGNSFSYSKLFAFLVAQAGFETYQIVGLDNIYATWSLTAVKIGDSYFYFDPYRENQENKGQQVKYFGMTSEQCTSIGLGDMQHCNYKNIEFDASDLKFEQCWVANSFVIDNGTLVLITNGDKQTKIKL